MYNSDYAIKSKEDDLLGRAPFAAELAKAIINYSGKESMVIGLYGKWGCGKTSLVNMVVEAIEESATDNNSPLIINYSPWLFSNDVNLIEAYFKTLRSAIKADKTGRWKNSIGEALNNYADAWDVLNFIPGAGPVLAPAVKSVTRFGGAKLSKVKSIEEAKEEIADKLIKNNQKIIVIIDDIDRLSNSQIRAVFQLVKQIAAFPNTIYVMPMDRDVVTNALQEVQNNDGNAYLEKIVQIPFSIPEISITRMQKIVFEKLDELLKKKGCIKLDKNYWSSVFYKCVWPFIGNLRDINRIINTLEFKINMVNGEICIEDIIGLTSIDVQDPNLYNWIKDNKNILCGDGINSRNIFLNGHSYEKKELRNQYIDSLKKAGVEDTERAICAVSVLFPHFANEIDDWTLNGVNYDVKKNMRIADSERANLLFGMDLDDIKISRDIINKSIKEYDDEEYLEFLEQVNTEGNIFYYLNEIIALIDEIPEEKMPVIIKSLFMKQIKFVEDGQESIFSVSSSYRAESLIESLFDRMKSEEDRYKLLKESIESADINAMEGIGYMINKIELGYGRLAANGQEKKENQIVTLNQLLDLEKLYARKAKELADKDEIVMSKKLHYYIYLWRNFSEAEYKNYIINYVKNKKNLLKLITKLAGSWTGTGGSGWSYYNKNYSDFTTDEFVLEAIDDYDKGLMCNDFSDEELNKLATFKLNYNKSEIEYVTKSQAEKLVLEWKKGQ